MKEATEEREPHDRIVLPRHPARPVPDRCPELVGSIRRPQSQDVEVADSIDVELGSLLYLHRPPTSLGQARRVIFARPRPSRRSPVGARTDDDLVAAEGALVFARAVQLLDQQPVPSGDLSELKAIHRHLFQDLFGWAGQVRPSTSGSTPRRRSSSCPCP